MDYDLETDKLINFLFKDDTNNELQSNIIFKNIFFVTICILCKIYTIINCIVNFKVNTKIALNL